jgi:hypothetical protein
MPEEYKPRLSFEITEEQQIRANKLLNTYGLRRTVFGVILDDLLDLIEQHGQIVVGILLERSTKPREILPSLAEAERKSNG